MELAQCRLVTDDVEGLAGFYARLLGVPTALNEYYVEIQAGPASVGFSRRRFTEYQQAHDPAAPVVAGSGPAGSGLSAPAGPGPAVSGPAGSGPAASGPGRRDEVILDLLVDDVDAEYPRIATLDVDWVMPPTTQPWGNRSMMFRDPAGNLVNVFSRAPVLWRLRDGRRVPALSADEVLGCIGERVAAHRSELWRRALSPSNRQGHTGRSRSRDERARRRCSRRSAGRTGPRRGRRRPGAGRRRRRRSGRRRSGPG
jgi:glyoxalase/bleomycin resistance protein/dioxygenase superfamily protein